MRACCLVHLLNELVDEGTSVTPVTTSGLDETVSLGDETTLGGLQLEGPHELVGLLEVLLTLEEGKSKVINTVDAKVTEVLSDHLVRGDTDALTVDLGVAALVKKSGQGLEGWLTEGNLGGDKGKKLLRSTVETEKRSMVEAVQAKKGQNLTSTGGLMVDTGETDDEGNLGVSLLLEHKTTILIEGSAGGSLLGNHRGSLILEGLHGGGKLGSELGVVLSLSLLEGSDSSLLLSKESGVSLGLEG